MSLDLHGRSRRRFTAVTAIERVWCVGTKGSSLASTCLVCRMTGPRETVDAFCGTLAIATRLEVERPPSLRYVMSFELGLICSACCPPHRHPYMLIPEDKLEELEEQLDDTFQEAYDTLNTKKDRSWSADTHVHLDLTLEFGQHRRRKCIRCDRTIRSRRLCHHRHSSSSSSSSYEKQHDTTKEKKSIPVNARLGSIEVKMSLCKGQRALSCKSRLGWDAAIQCLRIANILRHQMHNHVFYPKASAFVETTGQWCAGCYHALDQENTKGIRCGQCHGPLYCTTQCWLDNKQGHSMECATERPLGSSELLSIE